MNEGKRVVLYFRADWCSTCPPVEAALVDIIAQHSDRLTMVKIDVHERPDFVEKYNILSVPTVLLMENDQLLWRKSGFIRREDLVTALGGD